MNISTKDEWAFPCPAGTGSDNGMTLRDYFAAKALQGMLCDHTFNHAADEYAQRAYKIADAMLEARK